MQYFKLINYQKFFPPQENLVNVTISTLINPLNPNNHIQILQIDFHTFPYKVQVERIF